LRTVIDGPAATVAAFLTLIVLLALVAWFNVGQRQGADLVGHTLRVENSLDLILLSAEDAETGQRGFLLTSDENYLAPYRQASSKIDSELQHLSNLVSDSPSQVQRLAKVRSLAAEKFAELERTLGLYRGGHPEAARELVLSGAGKTIMDSLRAEIAAMNQSEARLLESREATLDRIGYALWAALLVGAGVAFALAVLVANRQRRQVAAVVASERQLRDANRRLLDEAMQRQRAEDQLRQSQKMEAVGQLAGGLAHDFNNMLAVILGALDIARRRLGEGAGESGRFLDAARDGATRAATLIERLLAFSRRQPLAPRVIDLNKLVSGMSELLRRTLGETLQLETVLAGGLWRTSIDATQLENSLLNLAINARDAMPNGGNLTIETANTHLDDEYAANHVEVVPGQYVMLAVSDTGVGMATETINRAFDPFFTTKATGKGTGLGLSQVHGFVKQSGGHIKIYSEVGQGTTVKLYLPRSMASSSEMEIRRTGSLAQERMCTVLVVEDDEQVRRITVDMLRQLGHAVLYADGGPSALKVLASHPDIDLLLTDVVMPDMNGRELSEAARRLQPGLKLLFMTGYTRNAIVHAGVLDPDVQMIAKPFTLEQLAAKLTVVLAK
jgi:signal transduction histidine kinase/CheY-like chemotaxis protein